MADEPINLVLDHLKAIRADLHDIRHTQQEHGQRQIRMELALASLRRDQAGDAESVAYLGARVDKLSDEIDLIKRRLDIVD